MLVQLCNKSTQRNPIFWYIFLQRILYLCYKLIITRLVFRGMKCKGALAEYSRERADDLMRAYDKYISSCERISMPDVYRSIVNMPASRFWVSDKRAVIVVSAIINGSDILNGMWSLKREMYSEIYNRVMALKAAEPDFSLAKLCRIVVMQPAPKFYISPGTAKAMVCKVRKEWNRRKRAKLRLFQSR